ncbi:hypothetical protein [Prescottella subtropica]|uniref:hypothetical protein n=1 Tax=Prescottella subtropica TaxID=2545757 RepID=UPI0010FA58DF|nr:hypothetical protein [Prescottella subtropica]
MHPAITTAFAAAWVVGGVLGIIWARRNAECRGPADTHRVIAVATTAVWFGALPLIGAIGDSLNLSGRALDLTYAVVLTGGVTLTARSVIAQVRARRTQFREHQQQLQDEGAPTTRYFWQPGAIAMWTFGVGVALVFAVGIGAVSLIGALIAPATVADVDRISQPAAYAITTCLFALLPISAGTGLWRWQQIRREHRQHVVAP